VEKTPGCHPSTGPVVLLFGLGRFPYANWVPGIFEI
jgi:hypothetical protein